MNTSCFGPVLSVGATRWLGGDHTVKVWLHVPTTTMTLSCCRPVSHRKFLSVKLFISKTFLLSTVTYLCDRFCLFACFFVRQLNYCRTTKWWKSSMRGLNREPRLCVRASEAAWVYATSPLPRWHMQGAMMYRSWWGLTAKQCSVGWVDADDVKLQIMLLETDLLLLLLLLMLSRYRLVNTVRPHPVRWIPEPSERRCPLCLSVSLRLCLLVRPSVRVDGTSQSSELMVSSSCHAEADFSIFSMFGRIGAPQKEASSGQRMSDSRVGTFRSSFAAALYVLYCKTRTLRRYLYFSFSERPVCVKAPLFYRTGPDPAVLSQHYCMPGRLPPSKPGREQSGKDKWALGCWDKKLGNRCAEWLTDSRPHQYWQMVLLPCFWTCKTRYLSDTLFRKAKFVFVILIAESDV